VTAACCHRLLHNNTTIEDIDNIVAIIIFATKPLKKATTIVITFFCNKGIEKGDENYRRPLPLFKHKEEGDNNKLMSPSSL
jgi:hypothetical protein